MTKKNLTFVFLTIPAFGHINPMLIVIEELVRLGHKVIVYNQPEFKKIIEKTGAKFKPPPVKFITPDFLEFRDSFRIAEMSLEITQKIIFPLTKSVKGDRPDCIIHDSLGLWGKLVAKSLNVPSVALIPSMVINIPVLLKSKIKKDIFFETVMKLLRFIKITREYSSIYKTLSIKPPVVFDIFSNKEDLNIVFTSKYLQINGNKFSSDYKFVGPSIYDRNQSPLSINLFENKKKIIYISLGSIYNDKLDFYKTCIKAFKNSNFQVFISIGKHIQRSSLGYVPKNIYIDNYLPQLQILAKADLFITHGGMNSINESSYYEVPMLLFPQMLEQKANAFRIEELEAGLYSKKDNVSSKKLMLLVREVINNQRYKKGVMKIRESLLNTGGYAEAVKTIINFTNCNHNS
jgi:MGT family glycosyltransferase